MRQLTGDRGPHRFHHQSGCCWRWAQRWSTGEQPPCLSARLADAVANEAGLPLKCLPLDRSNLFAFCFSPWWLLLSPAACLPTGFQACPALRVRSPTETILRRGYCGQVAWGAGRGWWEGGPLLSAWCSHRRRKKVLYSLCTWTSIFLPVKGRFWTR